MRRLDLSLRYKVPLWGSLLVLVSVLSVCTALILQAYEDLHRDVRISATTLAHTLGRTLFPVLLHDDIWHAYELIDASIIGRHGTTTISPTAIFVVDDQTRIVVSTQPRQMPMLTQLAQLGPDYRALTKALANSGGSDTIGSDITAGERLFFTLPIRAEGAQVGILVLEYSRALFQTRFQGLALQGLFIGLLVLAVLLPLNWYLGVRFATPLVDLAGRLSRLFRSDDIGKSTRRHDPHKDEISQLFSAYDTMLVEMQAKAQLEKALQSSERLNAIGRLAAGIAHEVNNPLGGMLMALDTLKARGDLPAQASRTLGLFERGLSQIQDTVSALLVQVRDQGRLLTAEDMEDVRTLIQPQIKKKFQYLDWDVDLPEATGLPAGPVRQVLINLLLNATQATPEGGRIGLRVVPVSGGLGLTVCNASEPIAQEDLQHLFEPFVTGRDGGHGLGLWVTYQIVQQLAGRISAHGADGEVCFEIWLPMETKP